MNSVRFLHAADLHLDSPFEALGASKAAVRRSEQRQLLQRLAALVREEQLQFVLLPGDLLDSELSFAETGEALCACLAQMAVPVFIAPGNHDFYSAHSPYAKLNLPGNVTVFTRNRLQCATLPSLGVRVYGAAYTAAESAPLLQGFRASREDGLLNLLCLHAEVTKRESPYAPVSEEELAASGLHYAAFGHIHKASGLRQAGKTWYAWPGCPEGRGFDETGDKGVYVVTLSDSDCRIETVSVALRHYRTLNVNVTGTDPLLAIHSQLDDETARDVYRITLSGEVDVPPDMDRLQRNLCELFYALQLRDETRLRQELWNRAGEDSLRGLFLKKLHDSLLSEKDPAGRRLIEQAARWGLAALEHREEVLTHEDP